MHICICGEAMLKIQPSIPMYIVYVYLLGLCFILYAGQILSKYGKGMNNCNFFIIYG